MAEREREGGSTLLALSNDLAGAVERVDRAIVAVNARHRVASSGLHWGDGVVVTADHTLKRDEEITLTLHDGTRVPASLVGRDPSTDLAVLKAHGTSLPTAEADDGNELRVGTVMLAVARTRDGNISASVGIIGSLGGAWRTWRGGQIDRFIRLDLALYPGFSGGPLVDGHGRIVGVNTSGLSRHWGVTIPAATVSRVTTELLEKGRVARAYLGIGMQPVRLPDALRGRLSLSSPTGVIVLNVEPGGPAENAGVMLGDVLVALDGNPVSDTDDVQTLLWSAGAGTTLQAAIVRAGELIEAPVTAGEWPRVGR